MAICLARAAPSEHETMKQALKRSQFILGFVRALRGLMADIRVVRWLVGRRRKIKRYLRECPKRKLHVGTSNNLLEGWLNTDIFLNNSSVVYLDATRRFPFDDATFDYIMAEHMIEHIEYQAAQVMLRECFRVIKPGGRVRFATPDLSVLLGLHSTERTPLHDRYLDWVVTRFMPEVRECKAVFVINNAFRAWGHSFLYDRETLRYALHTQGFCDIKFYKPGVSEDPNLKDLERHGAEIQAEDINQFETMVVEARKKQ
jgi:predicted SAM-dependent methyltransferase